MSEPLRPESTRFVYRHIWEIEDDGLPISNLKAEAGRQLSDLFGLLGVRPTARARFSVSDDSMLVAEVPVLRLAGDAPADDTDEDKVRQAIREGKQDGHIAAELGVPRSVVEAIRAGLERDAEEPARAGVAG